MLVNIDDLTFGYDGVPILSAVSFSLSEGEKVGFIGGNGEGKTTLIKLILGELDPDEGSVFLKNGITIGYLEQTGGLSSGRTVYEEMENVFKTDKELIQKLRETELLLAEGKEDMRVLSARIESLHKRIDSRDSYHYDVRIRTVLNGMGFGAVYNQNIDTMSGGEKTRLKLCRLLLEEPDLLILDEPTNHLDIKTLFWLEDYLTTYKGALLVVSHDRYFLDKLTSRTLELERGKVVSYRGSYSKYKVLKAQAYEVALREYEKQQEEIARLQEYVDKNIVRATTAKSAQSRVKQLERMEVLEKPLPPVAPPRFRFTYSEDPYEKVLSCPDLHLVAGEKVLIDEAQFTLMRGQKCALTGDNGTGKTTLLKFLLSKHPSVEIGKFVKIGYYDQEQSDLDPEERVLDAFWGKHSLLSQTDARKLLAQSGLVAEDMDKKVKSLSGGERAKLELALLQASHGNVLLLDEPTNHLDLSAREALEEALKSFSGTLLFVSHDRYFIQALASRIDYLEDGTLTSYMGSYEEFLEYRKRQNAEVKSEPVQKEVKTEKTSSYRSKEDRAQDAKKKLRMKQIETRLEEVEAEEEKLNEELGVCGSDYKRMNEVLEKLNALHTESDKLYAEYETLL